MKKLLKSAIDLNLFTNTDVYLSLLLSEKNNLLLIVIFSLLSAQIRLGHVCLSFDLLHDPNNFFHDSNQINFAFFLWKKAKLFDFHLIYNEIYKSYSISFNKDQIKPLFFEKNKLYFYNMWLNEEIIVNFFYKNKKKKINEKKLVKILNFVFPKKNILDWQKIAVLTAITNKISIIIGEAGTGKTTIIARFLLILLRLYNNQLNIQLVAPTGKAAVRLTESINLYFDKNKYKKKSFKAKTIHRLLGFQKNNQSFLYNKNNKLILDVLIIDESSMIDLSVMAKLIESIPNHAYVIFLGDPNQLFSVGPGSILDNLSYFSNIGYSQKKIKQFKKLSGLDLSYLQSNCKYKIKDSICLLKENYRFKKKSKIYELANLVKEKKIKEIKKFLFIKNNEVKFYSICSFKTYKDFILEIIKPYLKYFKMIKKTNINYKLILSYFNQYRILTPIKTGPFGVKKLNFYLEKILSDQNLIKYKTNNIMYNYYEGCPIMIKKNDYNLKLFNGDLGIVLNDNENGLKAYFMSHKNHLRKIALNLLPEHETSFVMTIHKSQGSEFKKITLIIPPSIKEFSDKNLIYTAITRAKDKLNIFSDINVFIQGILKNTKRNSGLIDKLISKYKRLI
ncbi:MAG: exodeoxyribonuclease V subunit alpha [Arsenophonus sp.]|nr:MAG: exodeoxyribonuclease V subunit alpha [Arsenophonus sp.]